jgi:hypothetical protein
MWQKNWNFTAFYLDFIQLWYISLICGFAFGSFKSSPQDFGLFGNGSKFQNFRLSNGEIWKSQYHIYLFLTVLFTIKLTILSDLKLYNLFVAVFLKSSWWKIFKRKFSFWNRIFLDIILLFRWYNFSYLAMRLFPNFFSSFYN